MSMSAPLGLQRLNDRVGQELGVSEWIRLDQDRIAGGEHLDDGCCIGISASAKASVWAMTHRTANHVC